MAQPVQTHPCQALQKIWTLESKSTNRPLGIRTPTAYTEMEKWVRLVQEPAMAAVDENSLPANLRVCIFMHHRASLDDLYQIDWYYYFCKYPTFWNSREGDICLIMPSMLNWSPKKYNSKQGPDPKILTENIINDEADKL